MLPVHGEPRYLIGESAQHVLDFLQARPLLGSMMFLGVFGVVLGFFRWQFRRAAVFDMIIFACIITLILVGLGSILYTYLHYPGFHFGG